VSIAVLAFLILSGFLFLNTLYLQEVRHLSPLHAGLATLPMTAMVAITAPLAGRLVGRSGARIPLTAAGLLIAAGAGVLTLSGQHAAYWVLAIGYLLLGVGFGCVNPPITNTAISSLPRSQSGTAAAIASAGRSVGGVLGVALLGSLASPQAPDSGWLLLFGCGVAIAVIAFATTGVARSR
jgi:MFS family permease